MALEGEPVVRVMTPNAPGLFSDIEALKSFIASHIRPYSI